MIEWSVCCGGPHHSPLHRRHEKLQRMHNYPTSTGLLTEKPYHVKLPTALYTKGILTKGTFVNIDVMAISLSKRAEEHDFGL